MDGSRRHSIGMGGSAPSGGIVVKRVEDWPERLHAFIESRRDRSFEWGGNDCCVFCADEALELTGEDPMAEWRGRYDSRLGAARMVVESGCADLAELVGTKLPEIPSLTAQRGDWVMFEAEDGPALAVVMGTHAAGVGPQGVTWVPMDRWTRAWKVGCSE